MPDEHNEILNHLMEIKVDLAVVKTDTGNIKEDVTGINKRLDKQNSRVLKLEIRNDCVESWKDKIVGGSKLAGWIVGGIGVLAGVAKLLIG